MEALPGRVVAKTGAEGGFALALVKEGLGVAVKIEDGSSRALNPTIVHLLAELGLLTSKAQEALTAYRQPAILNHRQQEVGRIRPAFSLTGQV
jgi:L-asparaginase II